MTHRMESAFEAYSKLNLDTLLKILEAEACREHDGHYTIMRFTTHFKVGFGTPDEIRKEAERITAYPSLREAVIGALVSRQSFYWGSTVEGMLR